MGTFRNVSQSEPCPICGKPDWCSILKPSMESYPGEELYVCRRIQQNTISTNGITYTFIKELNDGSSLYAIKKDKVFSHKSINREVKERPAEPKVSYPKLKDTESLDSIYRSFLQLLPLSARHFHKLSCDGWPETLIKQSLIRSVSFKKSYDSEKGHYSDASERVRLTKRLVDQYGPLDGVPGFYQDESGNWTFSGRDGMLIPIYDLHKKLYRLRLRLDKPPLDENGKERNKYKNFSSYHCEKDDSGNLANAYSHGSRAGSCIGLYCHPETDNLSICYITEGEKKALLANNMLKCPVISLPGTGTYKKVYEDYDGINVISYLKSISCTTIVVAYDADKIFNQQVKRYEKKLTDILLAESFTVFTADWNIGFGKGIDDILPLGIFPTLKPV